MGMAEVRGRKSLPRIEALKSRKAPESGIMNIWEDGEYLPINQQFVTRDANHTRECKVSLRPSDLEAQTPMLTGQIVS